MPPAPDTVLSVGAIIVAAVAGVLAWRSAQHTRRLEVRLEAFLRGRDGQSLEELLRSVHQEIQQHAGSITELRQASAYLHRALQLALRKVAFERYNPFSGLGGNQSFTLVLLDAHNTGILFTSLHNRDATRVYAKAIKEGAPLHQLSDEETLVLQNALAQKGA